MWYINLQNKYEEREIKFYTLKYANYWYMRFKKRYNWYYNITLKHYAE